MRSRSAPAPICKAITLPYIPVTRRAAAGALILEGMARMAKRPGSNPKNEWAFFNVIYEDGSQRSNRRVPLALVSGPEKDAPARDFIMEQDREIAEKSGQPPLAIASIFRVGAKPPKYAPEHEKEKA